MNRMMSSLAAVALLATAVTAPAAARTAQGEKAEAASGRAEGAKKICKRLETSGTRLAERACLTKEEWKKVEAMD